MNLRTIAIDLFLQTLRRISVPANMKKHVSLSGSTLDIGGISYRLPEFSRVVIVAMGKAAGSMFEAIESVVEPALGAELAIEGIIVGTVVPPRRDPRFRYFLGSHPIPDGRSSAAADAILKLLQECDESCLVLFLISGGASAMVEKPLDASITMDDVALLHRALVQSGLPITEMNVIRKHFSQVKGGRLAVAAARATQCTLILSDIPGAALNMVGSGPSLPDPSTLEDCRRLIEANLRSLALADKLLTFFRDPLLPETAKPDHTAFARAKWISLLSSDDLCREAADLALQLGFSVVIDNSCDDWDCRDAAMYLLDRITALHREHPRICVLSAGEVSVALGETHGLGGRNQHFVLECARLIADRGLPLTVLSGGSDGVDGNSLAAGAVCDETTLARAAERGFNLTASLAQFDSFRLLDAVGDAIITGPTNNNVRDLRILLMSV